MRPAQLEIAVRREGARLKDPLAGLISIRGLLPKGSYADLVAVARHRAVFGGVHKVAFPRPGHVDQPSYYFEPIGIENELRWARLYLSLFADELRLYNSLRSSFERAVLHGDGDGALGALAELEHELGESSWSVRQRVAALHLFEGLEAQKRYANEVRDRAPYGVLGVTASFASHRIEGSVSLERFTSQFRSEITGSGFPVPLRLYFEEILLPELDPGEDQLLSVLGVEAARSTVDYYEAVLRMCCHVVTRTRQGRAPSNVQREARSLLERLSRASEDSRAHRLLFELQTCTDTSNADHLDTEPTVAFEHMARGEYAAAAAAARLALADDPTSYGNMEVAARAEASGASAAPGDVLGDVIRDLGTVYAGGAGSEAAALSLLKTGTVFSDFGWGRALAGAVRHEAPPQVVGGSEPPSPTSETHASILGLSRLHPLYLGRVQTVRVRERYADAVARSQPGRLSEAYARVLTPSGWEAGLDEMDEGERELLQTRGAFVNRQLDETLHRADRLIESNEARLVHAGQRFKAWALLESGRVGECVAVVASVLLAHPDRRGAFPLEAAAEMAARTDGGTPFERAVLFDLHTRFVSDIYQTEGAWALEEFLTERGVSRPSELVVEDAGSKPLLVYLLHSVCREPVLTRLPSMPDSTSGVERERVEILRVLAERDPERASTYGNERAQLHQQITRQRQKQELDRSKVYVDVEGVRGEVQKLKDSYERYLGFAKDDFLEPIRQIGTADDARGNVQVVVMAGNAPLPGSYLSGVESGEIVVVKLPRNELDSLLAYLVRTIRDEYVSNSKHGLDGYLSMRIRHGTLLGEMRNPVEQHNLITQVDSETGDYQPNEHWLRRAASSAGTERLGDALTEFSEAYDAFTEKVKTDWVQVRRNVDEDGLFDFTLSLAEIHEIQEDLWGAPPPFHEFVDRVFDLLGEKLESSLTIIRGKFEREAKSEADQLLKGLQIEVAQSAPAHLRGDLLNEITATRTAVLETITKITRWFDSPGEEAVGTFSLVDAVRLAEQNVVVSVPGFAVAYEQTEEVAIRGRFASCFDIFYNVFDNAAKRSGISGDACAVVEVEVEEKSLCVSITNPVSESAATDEAVEHVESIRRAVEKERYASRVAEEGGTGLQKIANALLRDFSQESSRPPLEFGFEEGPSFRVKVRFPLHIVEGHSTLTPS